MKRIAITLMAVALCGCYLPLPPPSPGGHDDRIPPSRPVVPAVVDADYWAALAERVESGRINNTYELAQIVAELLRGKDISGSNAFDAAFPPNSLTQATWDASMRASVATKLRGLR